MDLRLSTFDYELPKSLIAQRPAEPRDASRLMVLKGSKIEHRIFKDLTKYLQKDDILILNDTRVIPARLFGTKPTGGKVELLLIKKLDDNALECLIKGKKVRDGTQIIINDSLTGKVLANIRGGRFKVEFNCQGSMDDMIEKIGVMPTPPYIKGILKDTNKYQTVFATKKGSVAAPTAGLHFTRSLMEAIRAKGVEALFVTLHVGPGTFLPVKTEDITLHKMEQEYIEVSPETAVKINKARNNGNRIIVVGTTTVKALESSCNEEGAIEPKEDFSDLYIYPGYSFRSKIDGFITNFHLPKSTLLMLTCAYGGTERILKAYEEAIKRKYKFYSFGDAMMIMNDMR